MLGFLNLCTSKLLLVMVHLPTQVPRKSGHPQETMGSLSVPRSVLCSGPLPTSSPQSPSLLSLIKTRNYLLTAISLLAWQVFAHRNVCHLQFSSLFLESKSSSVEAILNLNMLKLLREAKETLETIPGLLDRKSFQSRLEENFRLPTPPHRQPRVPAKGCGSQDPFQYPL